MISIVSERRPWEPKLKKPKELKGIKSFLTYIWGGITGCQAFIAGVDVWVNHHDWCSIPSKNTKYGKRHFVYNDAFNTPVVKGDAWIVLKGVMLFTKRTEALRAIFQECVVDGSRFCMDDCRMFEDVYLKAWEERLRGSVQV